MLGSWRLSYDARSVSRQWETIILQTRKLYETRQVTDTDNRQRGARCSYTAPSWNKPPVLETTRRATYAGMECRLLHTRDLRLVKLSYTHLLRCCVNVEVPVTGRSSLPPSVLRVDECEGLFIGRAVTHPGAAECGGMWSIFETVLMLFDYLVTL